MASMATSATMLLVICCAAAQSPCRTADTPGAPPLPRGVVSVVDGFGADPTGAVDSTAALQRALTAARTQNVTLFVPLGCYTITDTLNATEPRNGRWQPVVIVGQTPVAAVAAAAGAAGAAAGRRPAFVLPPATARFADARVARPVLFFATNWCLAPGAVAGAAALGCGGSAADPHVWENSAYQFNQALQGVDIVIGAGNGGAVGIDMNGAQGSTLEDVTVHAAGSGAQSGVAGGNGGGGSYKGLTVIGARYGVDMRVTGASPTYVGLTLLNQSCAAVLGGSASTMIATGLRIDGAPALGGVVAGIDPAATWAASHPECATPQPWGARNGAPRYRSGGGGSGGGGGGGGNAASAMRQAMSLVDSVVTVRGGAPCVAANGSLYISDSYFSGCATVVASGGRAAVPAAGAVAGGAGYTHVSLLGWGRSAPVAGRDYTYAFPSYRNGVRSAGGAATVAPAAVAAPPAAHASRHMWPADGGATWQTAGAVNVLLDAVGAVGDGVADDHAALQAALDAHDVVVLPKGFYRLSRPLVLARPGGALVGVGRTLSILMPLSGSVATTAAAAAASVAATAVAATTTTAAAAGDDDDDADDAAAADDDAAQPLLDVAADGATVSHLTLATWDHDGGAWYALHWRGGGGGVWRQSFFNRLSETAFPPFSAPGALLPAGPPAPRGGTPYGRALSVVSGGSVAFYDFNLDFGCCFGTAFPHGWGPANASANPDISSSGEVYLQRPRYRSLLVNGSTGGARFYPLNMEQTFGEAHAEVRHSKNVTFYGAKSENNYVVLWVRDSDLVTVHGYGGNASPFANGSAYGPGFWPGGPAGYAQFMPSSFRVQRSTRVRLANLMEQGRVTTAARPSEFLAAGNGTDPRLWNMVLQQDGEGVCDADATPGQCATTRVLDRPVLYEWGV